MAAKKPVKKPAAKRAAAVPEKKAPARKAGAISSASKKKVLVELSLTAHIDGSNPDGLQRIAARLDSVERVPVPRTKSAAAKTYQTSVGGSGPLHLMSPSLVNEKVRKDPTFVYFALQETKTHLDQWRRTGNGAFIWRAFRCLMHLEDAPDWAFRDITAYFRVVAVGLADAETPGEIAKAMLLSNPKGGKGKGNESANMQDEDYWFWVDFKTMTRLDKSTGKCLVKPAEARRLLAEKWNTTEPAVKQRLLRIEQAGQYATRSRNR